MADLIETVNANHFTPGEYRAEMTICPQCHELKATIFKVGFYMKAVTCECGYFWLNAEGANMIEEGLLWFDDNPNRATSKKIERAAARYTQKYGHTPAVCYVHPSHLKDGEVAVSGIKVFPSKSVLPFHFWLGVEKKK